MTDVLILAGGKGSRIFDLTSKKPKPLIKIRGKTLLWLILKHYSKFGNYRFLILGGYKFSILKKELKKKEYSNFNYILINTGLNTETGSRIKYVEKYLNYNKKNFFLATYGDGISDIDISQLEKHHIRKNRIATVTAVRPPARFGRLIIKKNLVINFEEKNKRNEGWINGGFFVFNKKIFNFIPKKNTNIVLEQKPLENLVKLGQLNSYKHEGFWQCCDNRKDYEFLTKISLKKKLY